MTKRAKIRKGSEVKKKQKKAPHRYTRCGPLVSLVLESGLRALANELESDRQRLCGERYRHQSKRACYRAGYCDGEVALAGRKVRVRRPRVTSCTGQEVPLPSWQQLRDIEALDHQAVEQMLVGVSTRKYERSLLETPDTVDSRGASKSAVSRRFVEQTEKYVRSFLHRDLTDLKLCALLVDGLHVSDHTILVAMGIDLQGEKHVLGLAEGATENATACKQLLVGLEDRGLKFQHSFLAVIDGSKALRRAIRDIFGSRAIVQRCQEHKKRNVTEQLPDYLKNEVRARMHAAYCAQNETAAHAQLLLLLQVLDKDHPGAAASLREGLEETLAVKRLGLPFSLERALSTTNIIENLMGSIRNATQRVQHWRNGSMIVRWVAMALIDAEPGLRPIAAKAHIPQLLKSLATTHSLGHHSKELPTEQVAA